MLVIILVTITGGRVWRGVDMAKSCVGWGWADTWETEQVGEIGRSAQTGLTAGGTIQKERRV